MYLDQYRGLSGLDTALFALLNTELLWQRYRERDWTAVAVLATLLTLMLGKIGWETITGNCLFVDTAGQFTPIPFAHLVGAVVGLTLGSLRFDRPNTTSPEDTAIMDSSNVRHCH
jgi:membrane associated rhomboid family serine protease